jgi:hypothetical protein
MEHLIALKTLENESRIVRLWLSPSALQARIYVSKTRGCEKARRVPMGSFGDEK